MKVNQLLKSAWDVVRASATPPPMIFDPRFVVCRYRTDDQFHVVLVDAAKLMAHISPQSDTQLCVPSDRHGNPDLNRIIFNRLGSREEAYSTARINRTINNMSFANGQFEIPQISFAHPPQVVIANGRHRLFFMHRLMKASIVPVRVETEKEARNLQKFCGVKNGTMVDTGEYAPFYWVKMEKTIILDERNVARIYKPSHQGLYFETPVPYCQGSEPALKK
jgi:hypothetical protein